MANIYDKMVIELIRGPEEKKEKEIKSLNRLLDPTIAYKCLISLTLEIHFYSKYIYPISRSSLSIFHFKRKDLKPLSKFQRRQV